jgi:hypothetical protein
MFSFSIVEEHYEEIKEELHEFKIETEPYKGEFDKFIKVKLEIKQMVNLMTALGSKVNIHSREDSLRDSLDKLNIDFIDMYCKTYIDIKHDDFNYFSSKRYCAYYGYLLCWSIHDNHCSIEIVKYFFGKFKDTIPSSSQSKHLCNTIINAARENIDKFLPVIEESWKLCLEQDVDNLLYYLEYSNCCVWTLDEIIANSAVKTLTMMLETSKNQPKIFNILTKVYWFCYAIHLEKFECADIIWQYIEDKEVVIFPYSHERLRSNQSVDYYIDLFKNKMPKINFKNIETLTLHAISHDHEYAFDQVINLMFEYTNFTLDLSQILDHSNKVKYSRRYQELLKKFNEGKKENSN